MSGLLILCEFNDETAIKKGFGLVISCFFLGMNYVFMPMKHIFLFSNRLVCCCELFLNVWINIIHSFMYSERYHINMFRTPKNSVSICI